MNTGELFDFVDTKGRTNRKRPGRAARRRRKKEISIRQVADMVRSGNVSQLGNEFDGTIISSSLPTDRSDVWPGVCERRIMHQWDLTDEDHLMRQLGYLPGNGLQITTRAVSIPGLQESEAQIPVVLQLYPLVLRDEYAGGKAEGRKFKGRKRKRSVPPLSDGPNRNVDSHDKVLEPFPTIFWLTHPLLRVWVSKLELEGLASRLEERLANECEAEARMRQAHESYGRYRLDLLTPDDLELVRLRQWDTALGPTTGVGGSRNFRAVKCLHAHLAHYLSGTESSAHNVVGEWVMEEVKALFLTKTKPSVTS